MINTIIIKMRYSIEPKDGIYAKGYEYHIAGTQVLLKSQIVTQFFFLQVTTFHIPCRTILNQNTEIF